MGFLEPAQQWFGKGEVHPEQFASPLRDHTETDNTHWQLKLPNNLWSMALDCRRKLERNKQKQENMQMPNKKDPSRVRTRVFQLWGEGANHLTSI